MFGSQLTEIEGIGDKSAEALLIKFKSAEAVFNAPRDDLIRIVGIAKANKILAHRDKGNSAISSGKQ